MTTEAYKPSGLSYSALAKYSECGQQYLLDRLYKVTSATYFATLAGKAVHEITEAYERFHDLGQDVEIRTFKDSFDRYIASAKEKGLEVKPSGKKMEVVGWLGGPNKKDYAWWLSYGPQMLNAWLDWKRSHPDWKVAILPDGTPGIEVEFEVDLDGEIARGYVDRVYEWNGKLLIVDMKTGKLSPSNLQLEDYFQGLHRRFGVYAFAGYYSHPVMPRGKTELVWKLTEPVVFYKDRLPYLAARYHEVRRGIEANVFVPNVQSFCERGCSVRRHCRAVDGYKAGDFPLIPLLKVRPTETLDDLEEEEGLELDPEV